MWTIGVIFILLVCGVANAAMINEEMGSEIDEALKNGDWYPNRLYKNIYNSELFEDFRDWIKMPISVISLVIALTLFAIVLILSLRFLKPIIFKKGK